MTTYSIKGLILRDLDEHNSIHLDKVYTKDRIPANDSHIPRTKDIEQWSHLDGVILPEINTGIDILVGNDVADSYTPLDVRTGPRGSPYASRTLLGSVVWNLERVSASKRPCVNRAELAMVQQAEDNRRLEQIYQKSVNLYFTDEKKEHSVEDQRFLVQMENSLQFVEGHYEMSLPFRNEDVMLPNNEVQAVQRLGSLKRKFQKNARFKIYYENFMEKIISKGYAEVVPTSDLQRDDGRMWYIPHHAVYHPRKPDKIRVVFDCASSFNGMPLNSLLLHGPDLTTSWIGALLGFRQE
jgi:hypothetical protein